MFALEYERDEQGAILFPGRDKAKRIELGLSEGLKHSTKNNLYAYTEIIKHTSEPGDVVADIMAGSGTILIAAMMGRMALGLELNPVYVQRMQTMIEQLGLSGKAFILEGDCKKLMPIAAQSIIFSPPYARSVTGKSLEGRQKEKDKWKTFLAEGNLASLNDFLYNQSMERIYRLCYESLVPGGYCTVIIRDHYAGRLVTLSLDAARMMAQAGLVPFEWHKWHFPPTIRGIYNKSKGANVVEEEDIIIFRKAL